MIDETSLDQLRSELRSTRRRLATLATGMVTLFVLGAAYFENEAVHGSFSIIDKGGKPVTILEQNGDVEVGGKLLVQKTDMLAELKKLHPAPPPAPQSELRVAEIGFIFPAAEVGLHPTHKFWAVTKGGTKAPVTAKVASNEDFANALVQASTLSEAFPGEVLASWITPTVGWHEMIDSPDFRIITLDTKVVAGNKIVLITCGIGKPEKRSFHVKVVVLYRERER